MSRWRFLGSWHAPNIEMIRRAHAAGVKFSMGSDCHDRLQIGDLQYVEKVIEELQLVQEDFFIPARQLYFE